MCPLLAAQRNERAVLLSLYALLHYLVGKVVKCEASPDQDTMLPVLGKHLQEEVVGTSTVSPCKHTQQCTLLNNMCLVWSLVCAEVSACLVCAMLRHHKVAHHIFAVQAGSAAHHSCLFTCTIKTCNMW